MKNKCCSRHFPAPGWPTLLFAFLYVTGAALLSGWFIGLILSNSTP